MKKPILKIIPSLVFTTLIFSSGTYAITANERNEEDVSITFMANGGKFSDDLSYKTKQFPYGCSWASIKDNLIPKPIYSGYDLVYWTFGQSKESTKVSDSYTFKNDVTIYAQWGANDPGTFASDSWATIINVADNGYNDGTATYYGLEGLKKAYSSDIADYGNTFVIQNANDEEEVTKKTRTVTLDGFGTYNVRVIGENHDLITNSDKAAALTFEFVNQVFPGVNYDINATESGNTNYIDSNLRHILENEFLMVMPEVLRNNMQSVSKKIIKGGSGADKDTIVTFDDKLFPLSVSELGITESSGHVVKYQIAPLEGSVYAYYAHNSSDNARVKKYEYTVESGGKSITKTEILPYWVRSFNSNSIEGEYPYAYYVNGINGGLAYNRVCEDYGVAPCFCIGKATSTANTRKVTYTESVTTGQSFLHSDNYVGTLDEYTGTVKFNTEYSTYKVASVTIKVGETELDSESKREFSYNSETGVISILRSALEEYSGDISIVGNIVKDGFKIDSWERFLNNCAQGYDYLKDNEWTDDPSSLCGYKELYEANGNSFVGLKRPIEVKRYKFNDSDPDVTDTYWVRVISELTDTFKNAEDKLRSTTFTFEFTELMKNEEIDWNIDKTKNNYDFTTSYIKDRLDALPSRFLNGSSKLAENEAIKAVTKKVYYKNGEGEDPSIKDASLKLFLLSPNELGCSTTGIQDGEAYDYYNDGNLLKTIKISDNNRVVSEKTPTKGKTYTYSTYNYYWTRTPNLNDEGSLESDPPELGEVYIFGSRERDGSVMASINTRYANYMSYEKAQNWGYTNAIQAISYAPAFAVGDEAPRFNVNKSIAGYNFTGADKATYGTTYNADITSKSVEIDGVTYTPNSIPTTDEISITIGGVDKTSECYTRTESKGTITIPGEEITGKINIAINEIPLNLTWDGLNVLAKYDEDNSKQGEFVKEYIHDGGTLTFTDLEETERKVKVIGFGHDPLSTNVSKKAALTMEFTDVLGTNKERSKYLTTIDRKGSTTGSGAADFTKSAINDLMNSYVELIPDNVKDLIKKVKKDYTKYNSSTETWGYAKYDAKLFPLSYNECNLSFYGLGEQLVEMGYILDNSSTYDYYSGTVKLSSALCNKRNKSYSYYIRSAVNYIDRGRYMGIYILGEEAGKKQLCGQGFFSNGYGPYGYTDSLAVCPAFCI